MNSAAKSGLVGKIAKALETGGLRRVAPSDATAPQAASESMLLALSGGADSVALLYALGELAPHFGYRLVAAHLNHRLRGEESDRDEAFVRDLCSTLGVELVAERSNDLDPAAPNLEELAREARWAFLAAAAGRIGASRIATAHHGDDQAETVMLRVLRGAGAAGLGAMAATRQLGEAGVTIMRPMLGVWRREILRYLDSIGVRYVSDSSNADLSFLRNRIRIELLPALERDYAPGLRRRLAALAAEMRGLDDYVTAAARTELGLRLRERIPGGPLDLLDLNGFAGLHPALAAAVLREFLAARIWSLRRLNRRHIDHLNRLCLADSPSATLDLPGGWRAERRYAALAVEPQRQVADRHVAALAGVPVALVRSGTTKVPWAGFVFHSRVMPADASPMPLGLDEACFDADLAASGLVVRNFARGDRVAPLGMEGTRKVQDVFVDRKLARPRRSTFPMVTLGGQVAWLPGIVRGRVALVSEETVSVLRLRAFEEAVHS
ncbi:MAG TPA: tRNA lysidine(34) synthetase TilS [Candidatus Binataceae bacterium]